MTTAQEFDEADEAKRVKYGKTFSVPTKKVSREIFPVAKRKGAKIVFEGEDNWESEIDEISINHLTKKLNC